MSEGQVDLSSLPSSGLVRGIKALEDESDAIRAKMSPKGALGLNPLLDRRRLEYGIPDAYFEGQAILNRVFAWQIPPKLFEGGRIGDEGILFAPETKLSREAFESPRAILLSCGDLAEPRLRACGVAEGHIVLLADPCPLAVVVDIIAGHEHKMLMLNDVEISGSEDLKRAQRAGKIRRHRDTCTWRRTEEPERLWDPLDLPEGGSN